MSPSGKAKENFQIVIDAGKKAEVDSAIGRWCESHPGSTKGDAFESVIPDILRMLAAPADPSIAGDVDRISDGIGLIQAGVAGISTAFGSLRSVVGEEYAERLDSQAKRIVELRERVDRYENGWEEPRGGTTVRHPSYGSLCAQADELERQVEELRSKLDSARAGKREAENRLNERLDVICRAIGLDDGSIRGDADPPARQNGIRPRTGREQRAGDQSQERLDFDGMGRLQDELDENRDA